MIPLYRSTLTRLDLSNVLSYMVDNATEGYSAGQSLIKTLCTLHEYKDGIAIRNPIDGILFVLELLGADTVWVPILAPESLTSRLLQVGKNILYYDVDAVSMSPVFHHATPADFSDSMVRLDLSYFGGKITYTTQVPQEFFDLPSLEISWAIGTPPAEEPSTEEDNIVHEQALTHNKHIADFQLVMLDRNTFCTSGGGALLFSAKKKHAQHIRTYIHTYRDWVAMTDLNASLASAQLSQLPEFYSRVRKILPLYINAIRKTRYSVLPVILHPTAMPQCFPILVSSPVQEILKYIYAQGIECSFPFQNSVLGSMLEALSSDKEGVLAQYPHGARYITHVIALPLYSALTNEEVTKIVKVISTLP